VVHCEEQGAGFIGSHVSGALLAASHGVAATGQGVAGQRPEPLCRLHANFVWGDGNEVGLNGSGCEVEAIGGRTGTMGEPIARGCLVSHKPGTQMRACESSNDANP
jgi:hypothetical protein